MLGFRQCFFQQFIFSDFTISLCRIQTQIEAPAHRFFLIASTPTAEYAHFRVLQKNENCLKIICSLYAGLVDWFNASFPSLKNGFDSRIPLSKRRRVLRRRLMRLWRRFLPAPILSIGVCRSNSDVLTLTPSNSLNRHDSINKNSCVCRLRQAAN